MAVGATAGGGTISATGAGVGLGLATGLLVGRATTLALLGPMSLMVLIDLAVELILLTFITFIVAQAGINNTELVLSRASFSVNI
jgi:hypothetical protein